MKVLVVEDQEEYLQTIKEILEAEGYTVIASKTGYKIKEMVVTENPNLVLLDITLPKKTGDKIAQELKGDIKTKKIPVVMVSANRDVKEVAHKVGAEDYLQKPFSLVELAHKVKKYIY